MSSNIHDSSTISTSIGELYEGAVHIDEEQLRYLVRLVDQCDVIELEVKHDRTKTRLVLRKSRLPASDATTAESCYLPAEATRLEGGKRAYTIVAPCVGLFQSCSKSKDKPFVTVGNTVKRGQLVGIILSLNILNEVESPVTGRIIEILVQDGEPVEYGQPLMTVEEQEEVCGDAR